MEEWGSASRASGVCLYPQRRSGLGLCVTLQPGVPGRIIDIAASSVVHYGLVEVLRLPVGRPPNDETAEAEARQESARAQ